MIMIQSARLRVADVGRDRRSSTAGAAGPRQKQPAKPAPWLPLGRYEWHAGVIERRPPSAG